MRIKDTTIFFLNFLTFKGVMSYDAHCSVIPVSWSSCSRTDFINQYNAHKNRWCMAAKTSNFCGKFKKDNLIDHSLVFSYIWVKKCNLMLLPHCKICISKMFEIFTSVKFPLLNVNKFYYLILIFPNCTIISLYVNIYIVLNNSKITHRIFHMIFGFSFP